MRVGQVTAQPLGIDCGDDLADHLPYPARVGGWFDADPQGKLARSAHRGTNRTTRPET